MCVTVITNKRQLFNGIVYYLCGSYYQHNGERLHRAVWTHFNGPVPEGFHVHHKDGNRANNTIENLELLSGHEHLSYHGHTEGRISYGKMHIERIRPLASLWHGTPEGKAWHSEHAKAMHRTEKTYVCDFCGKTFTSFRSYGNSNKFCHPNCKASYRRRRIREQCV